MSKGYVLKIRDLGTLVFYEKNNTIYFRNIETLQEKAVISGVKKNFIVTISDKDLIFLFCQNLEGDVLLCQSGDSTEFSNRVILNRQYSQGSNINFNSIFSQDETCIIYNLPSDTVGNFYLLRQGLSKNGQWGNQEQIDIIYGNDFSIDKYPNSNNYINIYLKKSPEFQLGYRNMNVKGIGEFNLISKTKHSILDYSYLVEENVVHFVYVIKSLFSSQVIYKKVVGNNLTEPLTIYESQRVNDCGIIKDGNEIIIYWSNGFKIQIAKSYNEGKTFSFANGRALDFPIGSKFKFVTNINESLFKANEIYMDNKLDKILFLSRHFENKKVLINTFRDIDVSEISVINKEPQTPKIENIFETEKQVDVLQNKSEDIQKVEKVEDVNNYFAPNQNEDINNDVYILKNKLQMMYNDLREKDSQIIQLTEVLKNKNNSIYEEENRLRMKIRNLQEENKKLLDEVIVNRESKKLEAVIEMGNSNIRVEGDGLDEKLS